MGNNKVAKIASVIAIFMLISKVLGFLREVLIASKFGAGAATDTFFIAISVSTLIGRFFNEAINTSYIPVISEVESLEGKQGKIEKTNNILNSILVISSFVFILSFISVEPIIKLLAKGFVGEQFNEAVLLTKIGLPTIFLSGIIGVFLGYLQTENKFISTAVLGIPLNLSHIIFLLTMSGIFGIRGLMISAVIGALLQIAIQIPELKKCGYKYKFILDFKDPYIRKIILLSGPILIGVSIDSINVMIDRTLASTLVEGSISALNYANKLNYLIMGVFITAITTVIFPLLSKEANNVDKTDFIKSIESGVNLTLLITIPATVGLIVLSTPIVKVAFERGAFDATDTLVTSQALIFYSIGLVFVALRQIVVRVYYSLQDTKTPVINSAIAVAINITLNLILIKYMAHSGLALATSIANMVATTLMFIQLKNKLPEIKYNSYFKTGFKIIISSAIMGLVAFVLNNKLIGLIGSNKIGMAISLLISVGVAMIIYAILCYLLKIEEFQEISHKFLKNKR